LLLLHREVSWSTYYLCRFVV